MTRDEDKTPILLSPKKRQELFTQGCDLFNEEKYFEAHEVWEELWKMERDRDKTFLQGLIQVAGHLLKLQKDAPSAAKSLGELAFEKLKLPVFNPIYKAVDVEPLKFALTYNLQLLNAPEAAAMRSFLYPKMH